MEELDLMDLGMENNIESATTTREVKQVPSEEIIKYQPASYDESRLLCFYDYRHTNGMVFSCILTVQNNVENELRKLSLEERKEITVELCRNKRNDWLSKHKQLNVH